MFSDRFSLDGLVGIDRRTSRWRCLRLAVMVAVIGVVANACGDSDSTGKVVGANQILIAASKASDPIQLNQIFAEDELWVIDSESGEAEQLTDNDIQEFCVLAPNRELCAYTVYWNSPYLGELWIMDVDGDNRRQITELNGAWGLPAWSPDGRTIAIPGPEKVWTSPPPEEARQGIQGIFLVDVETGSVRRLPLWEGNFDFPAWSPSGDQLAIYEQGTTMPGGKLWVVGVDGQGARELEFEFPDFWEHVWSGDGERIIFFVPSENGPSSLWSIDVKDSQLTKILDEAEPGWRLSPDGLMVAYTRSIPNSLGQELWVVGVDGSSPRRIAEFDGGGEQSWDSIDGAVEWSPESDRILWSWAHLQEGDPPTFVSSMLWIVDVAGERDPVVLDLENAPYRLPIIAEWAS